MANTGFVNCSHFKHQILVDDNTRYRQQLTHLIGKIRPTSILYEAGNISAAVKLGEQVRPHRCGAGRRRWASVCASLRRVIEDTLR